MKEMKNRVFHLNIYNFLIVQYFYLKIYLDALEAMLFTIKINVMVDFDTRYLFEKMNAYFLEKWRRNIHHWLWMNKIFQCRYFTKKYFIE